jgi:hypothetical protein
MLLKGPSHSDFPAPPVPGWAPPSGLTRKSTSRIAATALLVASAADRNGIAPPMF